MASPVLGEMARKALSINFSGTRGQINHGNGTTTLSGMKVSEEGAMRIAAVWIANTAIADEVSSLVYKLVSKSDTSRRPVEPESLRPLWDKANPDQDVMEWRATFSLSLTLHGVAYNMLGWNRSGDLGVMWPLDPASVKLERTDDQGVKLTSFGQGDLENRPGERPEFMMVPLYRLPGQLEPVSPVRYAAELLGLSKAYDETASRLMGRGMSPSAVVTADATIPEDEAERLSSRLERLHGGVGSAGKVAVLGGKGLKIERMSMSMADAEFLAQRQDVFNVVMALWRVPPTVAGMVDKPSTWGSGIAEFSRGLERFTIRPVVMRLQSGVESVTRWVDPDIQYRGRFDSLLSASPTERVEIQRARLMAGVTSVERVLAQDDEPPFGEDETVYSQLSLANDEDRRLARIRLQAEAYGALIRSGVEHEAAAAATGFDPSTLTHSGAAPVTLQSQTEIE